MYAEGADLLRATVINDPHIDPLIPPTVETELITIKFCDKVQKTRFVICPFCNTQGHTRHTCAIINARPSMG